MKRTYIQHKGVSIELLKNIHTGARENGVRIGGVNGELGTLYFNTVRDAKRYLDDVLGE